jgi:hypothetical protein
MKSLTSHSRIEIDLNPKDKTNTNDDKDLIYPQTSKDIHDYLKCVVCFEFSREAVECLQCGNIFCKFCVMDIKCPLCRNTSSYKDSNFARRIINSIPIKCEQCGEMSNKGNISTHVKICPDRKYLCKLSGCSFEGKKEEFHKHIISDENHLIESLNDFDKNHVDNKNNFLGLLHSRTNALGKTSRRGSSGKFYCGEKSDIVCPTCDGMCGPNSGCQCSYCMKLDMEFYNLPAGFTLNHDGNICKFIENQFFCGNRMGNNFCTPDYGSCQPCSRISNLSVLVKCVKEIIEKEKNNK